MHARMKIRPAYGDRDEISLVQNPRALRRDAGQRAQDGNRDRYEPDDKIKRRSPSKRPLPAETPSANPAKKPIDPFFNPAFAKSPQRARDENQRPKDKDRNQAHAQPGRPSPAESARPKQDKDAPAPPWKKPGPPTNKGAVDRQPAPKQQPKPHNTDQKHDMPRLRDSERRRQRDPTEHDHRRPATVPSQKGLFPLMGLGFLQKLSQAKNDNSAGWSTQAQASVSRPGEMDNRENARVEERAVPHEERCLDCLHEPSGVCRRCFQRRLVERWFR